MMFVDLRNNFVSKNGWFVVLLYTSLWSCRYQLFVRKEYLILLDLVCNNMLENNLTLKNENVSRWVFGWGCSLVQVNYSCQLVWELSTIAFLRCRCEVWLLTGDFCFCFVFVFALQLVKCLCLPETWCLYWRVLLSLLHVSFLMFDLLFLDL